MSTPTATTIEVSTLKGATMPSSEVPYKDAVEAQLSSRRVEACSRYHGRLLSNVSYHSVAAALGAAFLYHNPVCLSPDMIWLMIAQGVAHHINAHAEKLRSRFVSSRRTVRINVRRDDFVKGSPENPWSEVLDEFSSQIRDHVGPEIDSLVPAFSTTGPAERAASGVVLFDAIPSYFECFDYSLCSIKGITLEGTPEDWSNLSKRTQGFRDLGLERWIDVLSPILDHFSRASQGDVDQRFWQSIYHFGACGRNAANGWITAFFPYKQDRQGGAAIHPTKVLYGNEQDDRIIDPAGARDWMSPLFTAGSLPGGLFKAPFRWQCLNQSFDMEFLAGFVGVAKDEETLTVRPEIGWAVGEATTSV